MKPPSPSMDVNGTSYLQDSYYPKHSSAILAS